jgi:hypothetical protein
MLRKQVEIHPYGYLLALGHKGFVTIVISLLCQQVSTSPQRTTTTTKSNLLKIVFGFLVFHNAASAVVFLLVGR